MQINYENVKNVFEIMYYFSSIVTMFLIGAGLWQLKQTKEQISIAKNHLEESKKTFNIQSIRSATEISVNECRKFADTVVLDSLALSKFCKDNNISYFDDIIFKHTDEGFEVDPKNIIKEDTEKLQNAEELINKLINGLESYALFFLSGIADEGIAFRTNAKTYIKLCEECFKLFPILHVEDDDAEAIKTLYYIWRKKYDAHKLTIEKNNIDKKLSKYKSVNFKPIGTSDLS